ncbi:hypothetical protein HW45_04855 [Vibrio sp. ER1A]|nr:hypothetical protein HW45_04855 [Vibrio sp. ER1A]
MLAMVSLNVTAHSHQPQKIAEYVVQPVNKYQIELINMYPENMCYQVYIDGHLDGVRKYCLNAGEAADVDVWVNAKPDENTYKTVCTMPMLKGNLRVQQCTNFILHWPASLLQ